MGYDNDTPVLNGDEVDVEIISIGTKGDGIAKIDGYVIIVPDTKVGENVRVKVTNALRKIAFAEKVVA